MRKRSTLDSPLRLLLYGYPGSMKTRTAATAAQHPLTSPCLLMNAGGNPETLADYDLSPDIIDMERLEDFNDPYDWIMNGQPKDHPLVEEFGLNHGPYRSIIIDQLTKVQGMYFERVMGTSPSTMKVATVVPKREWEHYNKILYTMIRFASLYWALPIHVIMIAQEREGDPGTGRLIGPHLEGQAAVEVSSGALVIGRMMHVTRAEARIRKALQELDADSIAVFKQSQTFIAKDQQGGRLGEYMVNPTIPKMVDLIYGNTSAPD